MLRFIVLGDIPGTSIHLTFLQVLLLLAAFYGAILLRHDHRYRNINVRKAEEIALQALLLVRRH